jgi:hypothetical protein
MPDYRGRRTLGDQRPIPTPWEDGPEDWDLEAEARAEAEWSRQQAETTGEER